MILNQLNNFIIQKPKTIPIHPITLIEDVVKWGIAKNVEIRLKLSRMELSSRVVIVPVENSAIIKLGQRHLLNDMTKQAIGKQIS